MVKLNAKSGISCENEIKGSSKKAKKMLKH